MSEDVLITTASRGDRTKGAGRLSEDTAAAAASAASSSTIPVQEGAVTFLRFRTRGGTKHSPGAVMEDGMGRPPAAATLELCTAR